jgi:hypothetical protein
MSFDLKKAEQFELMKGQYISEIAALEYEITDFIKCLLKEKEYPEEFIKWFSKTDLNLCDKTDLLAAIIKEDSSIKRFRKLLRFLRTHKCFRNLLAHSFSDFEKIKTSRGKIIPEDIMSYDLLKRNLGQLQHIRLYLDNIRYPNPDIGFPISSDDFADGIR